MKARKLRSSRVSIEPQKGLQELDYHLYKYYNLDQRKLESIKNGKIWMSFPDEYNDPFEFYFNAPIDKGTEWSIRHGLYDQSSAMDEYRFHREKTAYKLWEAIRRKLVVCCFSEDHRNILMWSHYANSHKGICVEYDFKTYPYPALLRKVKYAENVLTFSDDRFADIFFTKAAVWSYEREWRLIKNSEEAGLNDGPIISKIYLGSEINLKDELSLELLDFAKKRGIPVVRMRKNLTTYVLDEEMLF